MFRGPGVGSLAIGDWRSPAIGPSCRALGSLNLAWVSSVRSVTHMSKHIMVSKRQRVTVRQVTDRATWAREMCHESATPVYVDQLQCQCTHVNGSGLASCCARRVSDENFRSGWVLQVCEDCRPSLIASTAVARQMFVPHCDVSVSAFVRRIESTPTQQRAVTYRCIRRFNASLAPQCTCSCSFCAEARGVYSWSCMGMT